MTELKARHVMNRRVTAATPRAIGRDLALQLLSGMHSGLPVVDGRGKEIGVVTEFDLLRAVHEGKDLQTVKAEEMMSSWSARSRPIVRGVAAVTRRFIT